MMMSWIRKKHNYLAAVFFEKNWGVSFLDISTGDFWVAEGTTEQIEQLLTKFFSQRGIGSKTQKEIIPGKLWLAIPLFLYGGLGF